MKKINKLAVVLTIVLAVAVVTGCKKKEPVADTKAPVNESIPSKDDNGKELSEQDKEDIAEIQQDDQKVMKLSSELMKALYNYTPETIEKQIQVAYGYCMDPKFGLFSANGISKTIETVKNVGEINKFISWNVESINYGDEGIYPADNKTYSLAKVLGTITYNSKQEGGDKSAKNEVTLGYDSKNKEWKVLTVASIK